MSSATAYRFTRPGGAIEVALSPRTAEKLGLTRDEAWERDGAARMATYDRTATLRAREHPREVTFTEVGIDADALTPGQRPKVRPPPDTGKPLRALLEQRTGRGEGVYRLRAVRGGWKEVQPASGLGYWISPSLNVVKAK